MGFKKYKKKMSHIKTRYAALRESRSHLKKLGRICLENINPITAPVALISQIQRSGGSLLSQLFDGHSEIYAHPDELMIGHPKKYIWPHFMFLPYLQKIIFLQYLGSIESITQRDIFNAYMTSYFGAWLNHQNNYGPKKFVTGFTPRLAMVQESIELFFSVYPDGRLISIIRDPKNWFPSAHRHRDKKKKYENIESASRQWAENAKAMVKNKEKYGHRVCIIRFENLISDIESVMRHLANFLNIEFDDILLTPTFNKSPITANTSFNAEKPGIVASTLSRYKTLNPQELKIIEKMTKAEYQSVLNKTVNLKESGN
jgi:hypothetical protein